MSNLKPLARLPHAAPKPAALSRKQKAAIIVRFLLNEGAELSLGELPDDLQAELTQLMGNMRYVDRETLTSVVMEFAHELESIGLAFPKGLAGALTALEGKISPMTAQRLRKEAGVREAGDPWQRLRGLEIDQLLPIIQSEAIEVSAVILAKLDVAKAAELLGSLPGDQARQITYAVSMTGSVTPEAVDRIGLTLAAQLDDIPPRAFEGKPVERVGEILNFSGSATRDSVLEGLTETDEDFAEQVRKAIFTFAHIPTRIAEKDVPAIIRVADAEQLVIALAFAQAEADVAAADFILNNISSRMADQLREERDEKGKINAKEGEAAMTTVVAAIRRLQAEGEITFIEPEEEEAEA